MRGRPHGGRGGRGGGWGGLGPIVGWEAFKSEELGWKILFLPSCIRDWVDVCAACGAGVPVSSVLARVLVMQRRSSANAITTAQCLRHVDGNGIALQN